MTLSVTPIILFLAFQIAFLPSHNLNVTAAHQVYVLIDVMCVVLLAPVEIFKKVDKNTLRRMSTLRTIGVFALAGFSFFVATIPDSFMDRIARSIPFTSVRVRGQDDPLEWIGQRTQVRYAFAPTAWLFEGGVNYVTSQTTSWFSRNLVVTNLTLNSEKRSNDDINLNLRSRNLQYAILDRSDLSQIDFTGANLAGASLREANLRGARFGCAYGGKYSYMSVLFVPERLCSNLSGVNMQGANLYRANVSGTIFEFANLNYSNLLTADISGANLVGASLIGANLTGANISNSDLRGSRLSNAKFIGTNMRNSDLSFAIIDLSMFIGSDLSRSNLSFSELWGSTFWGSILDGATFSGTSLVQLRLWQTRRLDGFQFLLANLRDAKLEPPSNIEIDEIKKEFRAASKQSVQEKFFGQIESLLNDNERQKWRQSEDYQAWDKLISALNRQTSISYSKNLATYVGDSLCMSSEALKLITDKFAYWESDYGYSSYSFDFGTPFDDPDMFTILSSIKSPQSIKYDETNRKYTSESDEYIYLHDVDSTALLSILLSSNCKSVIELKNSDTRIIDAILSMDKIIKLKKNRQTDN